MLRKLLVFAALLVTSVAWADPPFDYPEGSTTTGTLCHVNGVPVLLVSGSPENIGEAVGRLVLQPAQRFQSYPDDLLKHYHLAFLRRLLVAAGEAMVERFPEDYRREFEAMAATGVDREKLVLGNTLFDLKKSVACSVVLGDGSRSATEKPFLGRNLDYPSLGYAHEYSLVTVYRPGHAKHAFASVGFPGLVGCLSGMNDAGLSVAVLEVFQIQAGHKRIDHSGLPYALCYRRILEECSTIAEAQALLESMPRTTITNLAVADATEVAVLEITPRTVRIRPAVDGLCVATNHFCSPDLRPFVPLNLFHTANRFQAIVDASRRSERLDLAGVHTCLEEAHMRGTLQTMIFEPADRRLHIAIGQCPATAGEMKTLELSELFEELHRSGVHAAP